MQSSSIFSINRNFNGVFVLLAKIDSGVPAINTCFLEIHCSSRFLNHYVTNTTSICITFALISWMMKENVNLSNPKSLHFLVFLLIKSLFTKRFRDWSCGKLRQVLCCVFSRYGLISKILTLHFQKIQESQIIRQVGCSGSFRYPLFRKFDIIKFECDDHDK